MTISNLILPDDNMSLHQRLLPLQNDNFSKCVISGTG